MDLGFSPEHKEAGEMMHLDVAPKEENSVRDVAYVEPPPLARDFSRTEAPPHHPETTLDPKESKPKGWDLRSVESSSSDLVEVNRVSSTQQPPSPRRLRD
jgi:hypothetical protein